MGYVYRPPQVVNQGLGLQMQPQKNSNDKQSEAALYLIESGLRLGVDTPWSRQLTGWVDGVSDSGLGWWMGCLDDRTCRLGKGGRLLLTATRSTEGMLGCACALEGWGGSIQGA